MKQTFLFITIICAVSFAACKKNNPAGTTVLISAEVNALPWVSSYASASLSKLPGMHVTINADSSNTHLQLYIGNYTGPGTYKLTDTNNSAYYISYSRGQGEIKHLATSGTIVIDSNNASSTGSRTGIAGTFQFVADSFTVKNGIFDVALGLN